MRILCFGDSITWGSFDIEHGGWVSRLRHYFDNKNYGEPAVYNLGVSGDRLDDVISRFESDFESRKDSDGFNVVVIAVGINDSRHESYPEGTNTDYFAEKYTELINMVKVKTDKIIVLGPTNVIDGSFGYGNEFIKNYAEIIEEIASKSKLPFVDLFGTITSKELKADGLHPEAGGHQIIYDHVIKELVHMLNIKDISEGPSEAKLFTDGGSRGNPGPSAIAFVICKPDNTVVEKSGTYIGETTNNQAEYQALKAGLQRASELGIKKLSVNMDSELVVKQINGQYKIKNQELLPHYNEIKDLAGQFEQITFNHVPRALNAQADKEVNRILDQESKN